MLNIACNLFSGEIDLSIKNDIKNLLELGEFDKLIELAAAEKGITRYLTSFLFSEDELLHWRAVEGLEVLAKDPYILSAEKVRTIISRLSLNLEDQSGGNGWGSLEAIGALIAARPYQLEDQIPMLFSRMWDSSLRKGLLWSVRRIGEKSPELLADRVPYVIGLLRNPSKTTRGHAAWALGTIGDMSVEETLEALRKDNNLIRIYNDGELQEITISKLAEDSLASIKSGPHRFKSSAGAKKPLRSQKDGKAKNRFVSSRRRTSL